MSLRNLNVKYQLFFVVSILLIQMSCTKKQTTDLSKEALIPYPVSVSPTSGTFELKPGAKILVSQNKNELLRLGQLLAKKLMRQRVTV